jgi:hypothetical protein
MVPRFRGEIVIVICSSSLLHDAVTTGVQNGVTLVSWASASFSRLVGEVAGMAERARHPSEDAEAAQATGEAEGQSASRETVADDSRAFGPLKARPFAILAAMFLGLGLLTAITGTPFGSSRIAVTTVLLVGILCTLIFFANNEPG